MLEDTYQPHNANAIIRTAEIFGIQDIHVIQARNSFKAAHDICKGAIKWVDVHKHAATIAAIDALKKQGYTIAATVATGQNVIPLENVAVNTKIAVLFGNELDGLTETAMRHADLLVTIPMYGFTQSFNISVSAAIVLATLMQKLRASSINWRLSEHEQQELHIKWLTILIEHADSILADQKYR